jgi:hypothetical protein
LCKVSRLGVVLGGGGGVRVGISRGVPHIIAGLVKEFHDGILRVIGGGCFERVRRHCDGGIRYEMQSFKCQWPIGKSLKVDQSQETR